MTSLRRSIRSRMDAMTPEPEIAESLQYAVEADPGKCTASFPTFDTLDAASAAASEPCMERDGLPLPRVLVRRGSGSWEPVARIRPCATHWRICDTEDGKRHG